MLSRFLRTTRLASTAPVATTNPLARVARPQRDPAFHHASSVHGFGAKLKSEGGSPNYNLKFHENNGRMANGPPKLVELTNAAWRLDDRPREMALLVLDMQKEYEPYVKHIVPQCVELIDAFRAAHQICVRAWRPIFVLLL